MRYWIDDGRSHCHMRLWRTNRRYLRVLIDKIHGGKEKNKVRKHKNENIRSKRKGNAQLEQPKLLTERRRYLQTHHGCRLTGLMDDDPMAAAKEEGGARAKMDR